MSDEQHNSPEPREAGAVASAADGRDRAPDDEFSADTEIAQSDIRLGDVPDAQEQRGNRKRPDPTRYGDWENKGRCIDF